MKIKCICAQCGKEKEVRGLIRPLPPNGEDESGDEFNYFCSTKCIKAYNIAHDIPNDGIDERL